ncbi:hypothetical protein AB0F43_10870 [Kribbella sp. NPDC023972]|uniref:hypothetical protein n=1 Tax=Kribbella sp. NPDC023972 TaxID=3154795 RepID=UPI0033C96901
MTDPDSSQQAAGPASDERWERLQDVITEVFRFGTKTGGDDWAAYTWRSLSPALTSWDNEVGRVQCVFRILALKALHTEFTLRAFDEGSPGQWAESLAEVIGQPPLVSLFTIGQLMVAHGIDFEFEPEDEYYDGFPEQEAVHTLTKFLYDETVRDLRKNLSDSLLFATLFASRELPDYPLSDYEHWEAVNTRVTGDQLEAWEWITRGCPLEMPSWW